MLVYQKQQQLKYANGDNDTNCYNINILFQSYRFEKIATKNNVFEKICQYFFVL